MYKSSIERINVELYYQKAKGSHGRDRMVVGFTNTYAIIAYHH